MYNIEFWSSENVGTFDEGFMTCSVKRDILDAAMDFITTIADSDDVRFEIADEDEYVCVVRGERIGEYSWEVHGILADGTDAYLLTVRAFPRSE